MIAMHSRDGAAGGGHGSSPLDGVPAHLQDQGDFVQATSVLMPVQAADTVVEFADRSGMETGMVSG
jgi:hypothetical protein